MVDFDYGKGIEPGSWAYNDLLAVRKGSYSHELMPKYPALVVDVGAHVGSFSEWALDYSGDCCVVSFEPHPESFATLKKNLKNRNRCVTLPFAVSNDFDNHAILNEGMYTPGESSLHDIGQQANGFTYVQSVRLDQILQAPPDILKIDTEGHEIQVLEGLGDLINGTRYVAMEIHRQEDAPVIDRMLQAAGLFPYEIQWIAEHRAIAKYCRLWGVL